MEGDIRTIKRAIPQPIWRAARAAALLQGYKTFGGWLCALITWAIDYKWSREGYYPLDDSRRGGDKP